MSKIYSYENKLKQLITEDKTCKEAFSECKRLFKLADSGYKTFERRYTIVKKELISEKRRLVSKAEIIATQELANGILTRNEGLVKLSTVFRGNEEPKDLVPLFHTIAEYTSFAKRNDGDSGMNEEVLNGITKANEANPIYARISGSKKKYVCVKGGSRSGKTYAIAQMAVDWLLTGRFCGHSSEGVEGANFDVFREELTTLKSTVKRDIDAILAAKKLTGTVLYRDKPCQYQYADRSLRLKSCTEDTAKGEKREFIWINEADGLHVDTARQLFMRGAKKVIFDYNPSDSDSWLVKDFESHNGAYNKDTDILNSTFLDNYFLDEYVKEELIRLKDVNSYLYNVYTLGEYAQKEGVILTNVTQVGDDAAVEELLGGDYHTAYGMDFGAIDPTAIVAVHLPKKQNEKWTQKIFVEQVLYQADASIEGIKAAILTFLKGEKMPYIYADSANSQMIHELQRNGVNAVPCKKGSIFDGLCRLQSYEIIVRRSAKEINNELRMYSWDKDSSGKLLGKPIDKYNHSIDAIRYAMKALLG